MTSISASSKILDDLACRLDGELRALGFERSGKARRFVAGGPTCYLLVEIQQSSRRRPGEAKVTINAGVWMAAVAERLGGPAKPEGLHAMDCHWWLRCGQLDAGRQERWWIVGAGDELNTVVADITAALWPLLRLLAPLKTESGCLDYFVSDQTIPFLDPINRWGYALALAAAMDKTEAQTRAIEELRSIGQSRPLPMGHKLLLRSLDSATQGLH